MGMQLSSSLCFCCRGGLLTSGSHWLSQRKVFVCHFELLSYIAFKDYYVSSDTVEHKQYFLVKAVLQKEVEAFLHVGKTYVFFSNVQTWTEQPYAHEKSKGKIK